LPVLTPPYAKRFLGIDVREQDASRSYVKEVRLVTRTEADPRARFSVDTKGAEDRFLALSAQGLVSFQDRLEGGDLVWRFNPRPEADFGTKGMTNQTRTETASSGRRSRRTPLSFAFPWRRPTRWRKPLR
jgi:hypothetical protein